MINQLLLRWGINNAILSLILPELKRFLHLSSLDLSCSSITDAGITEVALAFPKLKLLFLRRTNAGNTAALAISTFMRELEVVSLESTDVQKEGAKAITSLPLLADLNLHAGCISLRGHFNKDDMRDILGTLSSKIRSLKLYMDGFGPEE